MVGRGKKEARVNKTPGILPFLARASFIQRDLECKHLEVGSIRTLNKCIHLSHVEGIGKAVVQRRKS